MGTHIEASPTVSGQSVLQQNTTRGTEGIPFECQFDERAPKDCTFEKSEQPKMFKFYRECFPNLNLPPMLKCCIKLQSGALSSPRKPRLLERIADFGVPMVETDVQVSQYASMSKFLAFLACMEQY
jgi:hypothetical protein